MWALLGSTLAPTAIGIVRDNPAIHDTPPPSPEPPDYHQLRPRKAFMNHHRESYHYSASQRQASSFLHDGFSSRAAGSRFSDAAATFQDIPDLNRMQRMNTYHSHAAGRKAQVRTQEIILTFQICWRCQAESACLLSSSSPLIRFSTINISSFYVWSFAISTQKVNMEEGLLVSTQSKTESDNFPKSAIRNFKLCFQSLWILAKNFGTLSMQITNEVHALCSCTMILIVSGVGA